MAIDGVFIHYLAVELSDLLVEGKVNKIQQPSPLDLIFQIRKGNQNYSLLISSKLSAPRIHITEQKWSNPEQPFGFCMVLRKYLERSVVTSINQIDNDRLIDISFLSTNELGDSNIFHLYVEIMGRNCNIILTTQDQIIIDAIRKLPPAEENTRIIIPKAKYLYAYKQSTINPYTSDLNDQEKLRLMNDLEGCSKLIKNEFKYVNSVNSVIDRIAKPTLFITKTKTYFYTFDLLHLEGERKAFPTLSSLLEYVFQDEQTKSNLDYSYVEKIIKKELSKQSTKIDRLNHDLEKAKKQVEKEFLALLLQTNLFRVKEGSSFIVVEDFYHQNEEVSIPLDSKLTPSQNLKNYFNLTKKAKRAIIEIQKQIKITEEEINYLDTILTQLSFANNQEIIEIKEELREVGYLKTSKRKHKVQKHKITTYHVDDSTIMVGKNNLQNNYLTHVLAQKNDFWFHVKGGPGSHVVLRTEELNEKLIRLCANLASYYSKFQSSSSVPVDYTQVKFIKKIPGMKGSNVTYKNQKTIYIDPDMEQIKKLTAL